MTSKPRQESTAIPSGGTVLMSAPAEGSVLWHAAPAFADAMVAQAESWGERLRAADQLTIQEDAALLDGIRTAKARLRDAEIAVEHRLAARMPKGEVEVEGWMLKRDRSTPRCWDDSRTLAAVVFDALAHRVDENGVILMDAEQAIMAAVKECAAFDYWRTTALKNRGLDPDVFSKRGEPQARVTVRRIEGES